MTLQIFTKDPTQTIQWETTVVRRQPSSSKRSTVTNRKSLSRQGYCEQEATTRHFWTVDALRCNLSMNLYLELTDFGRVSPKHKYSAELGVANFLGKV